MAEEAAGSSPERRVVTRQKRMQTPDLKGNPTEVVMARRTAPYLADCQARYLRHLPITRLQSLHLWLLKKLTFAQWLFYISH